MIPSSPPRTTARISPNCINIHLPQPSFSLQGSHDLSPTFSLKLDGSTHISPSNPRKKKTSEEDEIDVFPAEKYFSGRMDGPDAPIVHRLPFKHSKDKEGRLLEFGPQIKSGTPSVFSDASVNSRSSLLRVAPSNPPPTSHGRTKPTRLINILRCNCSKSVQVSTGVQEKPDADLMTGKPIVSTGAFGSPVHENQHDDDARSEASSDLFEIESISTMTNPCFTRSWTNGTLSTPTCYEPSEVSVEWSVVTASAAMDADCGELGGEAPRKIEAVSRRHHRGGLFAGCSSHEAVKVLSKMPRVPEKMGDVHGERLESRAATRPSIEERRASDLRYIRPGSS